MKDSERKYLQLVQWVRILDVVFIGPVMIYSGIKVSSPRLKWTMIILGILTILANAYNWHLYNKYQIIKDASGNPNMTTQEAKEIHDMAA